MRWVGGTHGNFKPNTAQFGRWNVVTSGIKKILNGKTGEKTFNHVPANCLRLLRLVGLEQFSYLINESYQLIVSSSGVHFLEYQ